MGFVSFVGADGQPNRSGPGVALQICTYYKEYLQQFDSFYIASLLEGQQNAYRQAGKPVPSPAILAYAVTGAQPQSFSPNANITMLARKDPQALQKLLQYSQRTVAELRQMGVPENTIQIVEANRATLQRAAQDQAFVRVGIQSGMQNGQGNDGNQGNGMGPGPQGPPFAAGGQGVPGQMVAGRMMGQAGMSGPGNFMGGNGQGGLLGAPLPQLQQTGRPGMMGGPSHPGQMGGSGVMSGWTKEQIQTALTFIARTKEHIMANGKPVSRFLSLLRLMVFVFGSHPKPECT